MAPFLICELHASNVLEDALSRDEEHLNSVFVFLT